MKKILFAALFAVAAIALLATAAIAQGDEPPFKIVWSRQAESQQGPDEIYEISDYGLVCVFDQGQLWCGCPCPTCENGVRTVIGNPPATPPTFVPTTPPPPPTEPPTQKAACNQGGGNGSEECDPGNSNNNQDSNDEPGSRGGGNN